METQTPGPATRDAASWAAHVERLAVQRRAGVRGSNVDGRRLAGPVQGFGKMWRKTYRCDIGTAATPERVIAEWREHFGEFWPRGSRFAPGLAGIRPGEVALIDVGVARGAPKVSTGVLVLYSDDTSFTFLTPQGHQFAGLITFSAAQIAQAAETAESGENGVSAARSGAGGTQIEVEALIRAGDPVYEVAMILGGHRQEDRFWEQAVATLARHLGAARPVVTTTMTCVDSRRQWRRWANLRHNAAIRSTLQALAAPVTGLVRRAARRPR
ncbi:MAG: hypothetical protein ACRDPY_34750 [Streptosporangiaceae bacterium]